MPLIQIDDVTKVFAPRSRTDTPQAALDGVSLDIEEGDIYGIIGYSGAGKSTLVRLINALEKPTSGSVHVRDVEVSALPESRLRTVRLDIGMVFQQFNLFTSRTVWGNIEYPLRVAGIPREKHQARISELLHFVGLAEHAHAYPDQLSGGQKQRVGIARALATSPSILLADEATSALDPETTREVLGLLKRVNEEFGVTIVVITHEMEVIRSIAHKVAVMEHGRIVERGPVFDIFSAPKAVATQRFVSTIVTSVPEGLPLGALRTRHPGRIVTFSFSDGDTSQSAVFLTLGSAGVGFELVYGGINEVQARTFGHLTLALTGDEAVIDAALDSIRSVATVTEVD
jgi:D-methionine transport system ATP-binding protein